MSEETKVYVKPADTEPSAGSSAKTFVAVALLLAAVVGGAYYINSDNAADQASVTNDSAATGASSGESGSSTTAPAAPAAPTPAPEANDAAPEKSAPPTQP